MEDDTGLLTELMLHAEILCARLAADHPAEPKPSSETELKINQSRAALSELQSFYEADELSIRHPPTLASFRRLVMSLMWASFYAGSRVNNKLYRKLLQIESGFTLLLIKQINSESKG